MSRISLVGGMVATLSDTASALREATVVIDDGLIVDVGATQPAGRVIDCAGKLVLPGFVNAHAHTTEVLYRGLSGGLDHVLWVERKHALQHALDEAGAQVGASLACLEMLRSGTVAFLDPEVEPRHFEAVAAAAGASGLRAGLSVAVEAHHGYGTHREHDGHAGHDGPGDHGGHDHHHVASGDGGHHGADGPHGHGSVQRGAPDVRLPPTSGRVTAWLGPRSMSALTAELGYRGRRRARASNGRSRDVHCAEDERDVEAVRGETGLTPARWAAQLGLPMDRSVLAHGVYLEPDDFEAIAAAGASVAHCPVSNAKTGHGVASLAAMEAAGINVALGTDGGMSNDTYDLFLELRTAGLIHRAVSRDPAATTAMQLLRMATRNGKRALGLEGGTIEAGAPADLVILEVRRVGSWPTHDPLDSLAFSSSREVVEFGDGRSGELLLDRGRPTRIDEQRLLADAASVAATTAAAAGLQTWVRAS